MQPKMSHVVSNMRTASIVTEMLNSSDRYQSEIAADLGFSPRSNALTMFKRGKTNIPISRIVPLGRACGAKDEVIADLMESAFREYYPEVVEGFHMVADRFLADDEAAILRAYRKAKARTEKSLRGTKVFEKDMTEHFEKRITG